MKKYVCIVIILSCWNSLFSQNVSSETSSCHWYNKIRSGIPPAQQLEIAKKYFREMTSIPKKDSCHVLYSLSVNDKYWVLSRDFSKFFVYPDQMIRAIKLEELDTILTLDQKTSKMLYGPNCDGVIHISSSSKAYEKRIDSIWRQKH